MAKIIIRKTDNIYHTFNSGDVLVTLSGVLPDGDFIAYEKDEQIRSANGIPVLLYNGETLSPRVLVLTSLTARMVEPIEVDGHNTKTPHYGEFNKGLLQRGRTLLSDNKLRAVSVSEYFPYETVKVGKSTFEFDLVKIDWTDKYASVANGVLTFEGATIQVSDIIQYFKEYREKQTKWTDCNPSSDSCREDINQLKIHKPMIKTNKVNSDFFISYDKIDDFQRQLIDKQINSSMVVAGSAGSGKSLIALHKAKQVAALGKSYAVIVYTKTLKKYFEDGLRELGLSKVYNYHRWKHNPQSVDCLIIDECQDFTDDEIRDMIKYGKTYYLFGDTDQSIMNFPDHHPQSVETTAYKLNISLDKLYKNYRLTKQVAKLAEQVGGVDGLVDRCTRNGETPHLIKTDRYDGQLDKIAEIIKNRNLTNVGILVPHNTKDKGNLSVEYVKDYLAKRGVTCEYKYNADKDTEMDLDFNSRNPKIMTWWCAKGLQFKDVFIPGCDYSCEGARKSALYVAMTRCSERLYLGYTGELSSIFPKASSEIYSTSGTIQML